MHPATIIFTYTGFIFSSGIFGWVMGGLANAFIAATVFSVPMLVSGLLAMGLPERERTGRAGLYLGLFLCPIISAIYTWRAYLAFVEQKNVPKGVTITAMVLAGVAACVLLYRNRMFGRSDN